MNLLKEPALVLVVILTLFSVSAALIPNLSISSKTLRQSEEPQGGLVLDICRPDRDCAYSERIFVDCYSVNRGIIGELCTEDRPTCRCLPDFEFTVFQRCNSDSDCIKGEVCVVYTPGNNGLLARIRGKEEVDFTVPFCASEEAEKTLSDIERHPTSSGSTPTGTDTVIDNTTFLSSGDGLALDKCRASECLLADDQFLSCECVNRGAVGFLCVASMLTCRCMPLGLKWCRDDYDCILGERCVKYTPGSKGILARQEYDYDLEQPFCASEEAEKNLADIELYPAPSPEDSDSAPTGNENVVDVTTPFSTEGGLFLDPCKDGGDCVFIGEISFCGTFVVDNVGNTCNGQVSSCRCMRLYLLTAYKACEDHDECVVGEGCARYTGERGGMLTEVPHFDFTRPFCVSLAAVSSLEDVELLSPAPSPPANPTTNPGAGTSTPTPDADNVGSTNVADEEICIDARAISELRPEELVFEKHVLARVLCDANGSCATPGHMVKFGGRVMRMSSYCEVSGGHCREARMLVNSPRYRRGLSFASRTEGLSFTAFAARYGTRVEEMMLAFAMRLGM